MKRWIAALAIVLGLGFFAPTVTSVVTAPQTSVAQAGECSLGGLYCGTLHHYNGAWDVDITVRCQFGDPASNRRVPINQYDPCKDMDQIYVPEGGELWCRDVNYLGNWTYWKQFDATGWHKTNDLFNESCTMRRD